MNNWVYTAIQVYRLNWSQAIGFSHLLHNELPILVKKYNDIAPSDWKWM